MEENGCGFHLKKEIQRCLTLQSKQNYAADSGVRAALFIMWIQKS